MIRILSRTLALMSCILLAAGCSHVKTFLSGGDRAEYALIIKYYQEENYQRSLEYCSQLLSRYPASSLRDEALYYTALNHLHGDASAGGYQAALSYFKKLLVECPRSTRTTEARTWVSVLGTLIDARALLEKQQSRLMHMEGAAQQVCGAKDREAAQLKREIEKLKKELELLKKVDIEVQQKKKDLKNAGKPGTN